MMSRPNLANNYELQPGGLTSEKIAFGSLEGGRLFWACNYDGELRRYIKTNVIQDCAVYFNAYPIFTDESRGMLENRYFGDDELVVVPKESRRWLDKGYVIKVPKA